MQDVEVMSRLAEVDLFGALSRRELKRLASGAREIRHDDGRRVIDEGASGLGFHMIIEGAATVSTSSGRDVTLGPGDYFGEMSLIDGQPRSATVTAAGRLRTICLDSSTFNSLLDEHPEAARVIMKALCARLRKADLG